MRKLLLALPALLLAFTAQAQLSAYNFSKSVGTYTPITGGTTYGNATTDDESFPNVPIGFGFNFNGAVVTTVSISANGFIVFGAAVPVGGLNTPDGAALYDTRQIEPLAAAFNGDLLADPSGEIRAQTIGTTPNRRFVVQWSNYGFYDVSGAVLNFQVSLEEGTNIVRYHYGDFTEGAEQVQIQVGLRDGAEYLARTSILGFDSTTAGTIDTATVAFNSVTLPTSGLTLQYQAVVAAVDLSVARVSGLSPTACSLSATEQVRFSVLNGGSQPVSSITAAYRVNRGSNVAQTFTLAAPLAAGDSTTLTFTQTVNLSGNVSYVIDVFAQQTGDTRAANDSASVRVSPVTVNGPYQEGFASATALPNGWTTIDNGPAQWTVVGPDVYAGSVLGTATPTVQGAGALFYNSFVTATQGLTARAISPCINLATVTSPQVALQFSQLKSPNFPTAFDSLVVSILSNGTLTRLAGFTRLDSTLTDAEWRLESVDLTPYRALGNIRVVFDATGADGNNIAIDGVNVVNPVSVAAKAQNKGIRLHPNPTTGQVWLKGATQPGQLEVFDIAGARVVSLETAPSQAIDLSSLKAGAYTYRLTTQQGAVAGKVIKQ